MKLEKIINEIEKMAPPHLALDWDNVGFLVGDQKADIKTILLTIDTTADVINEAKNIGAQLIFSYHPVIWDGLKKVTAHGQGAIVYQLVRNGIGVYSMHTAFDIANGGVNDLLAEIVGIVESAPIGDFVSDPAGDFYKLIVFIPTDSVNDVTEAIYQAGAGKIGSYSKCGFHTQGTGTFLPGQGAKPAIGKKGKFEKVNEIRFETMVPADRIAQVVTAMRASHPYQTPAFDVIRHYDVENKFGLGRMGKLAKPTPLTEIIKKIKKVTGADAIGIIGPEKRTIKKAAVCAGSCGKIISNVINEGCDLYLTGELKHHHAMLAEEAGLTAICLSHTVSERFALKNAAKMLKKELKGVTIRISKKDHDPFKWKNI